MPNIETKIASYESFIEDKLKADLRGVQALLDKKATECSSWQDLKNLLEHLQSRKAEEYNTRYDFGFGVYGAARIEELEKIIINIGCQCYLEMYYAEASKYVDIRIKYSKKEIEFLRKQAVNIKAHIKLVLLAIGELRNTI